MLLWFWYCKWRILADNSFATGCKRYEINSVNKVYCSTTCTRRANFFFVRGLATLTSYTSSYINWSFRKPTIRNLFGALLWVVAWRCGGAKE